MTEQWNEARRAQAKKASSYPTDPPRTKWLIALLAEALGEIERLEKESKQEERKVQTALNIANEFGTIDGDHHKMWVIDQMVQILATPEDYTKRFDINYEEYPWSHGIEP